MTALNDERLEQLRELLLVYVPSLSTQCQVLVSGTCHHLTSLSSPLKQVQRLVTRPLNFYFFLCAGGRVRA